MAAQVVVLSEEMIKPSSPTPDNLRNHKLSSLDQVAINSYIPLILFYESEPSCNIDRVERSKLLKQSLSDVLTKFYPLAGRMNGTLSVDCDDSGVMYVEAQVHADLSEMMKEKCIEELKHYIPIDPYAGDSGMRKDILLALQVTFFDCGGLAIGLCIYHKVADGVSFVSFVNTWAATCRGDTEFVRPDLYSASHHFPPVNLPDFDLLPSVSKNKPENFTTMRFLFDKNKLAELKNNVSSASGSHVKDPTRVEAVCAFIFKHFMELSRSKTEGNKKSFLGVLLVNLRPRMSPPLPDHAFGNVSAANYAVLRPEQAYHNVVEEFRKIKTKTNSDFMQQLQNREAYARDLMRLIKRHDEGELKIQRCVFSSWFRFPTYDADFGWGKPLYVCPISLSDQNMVQLMSTRCGEGIEAWVGMSQDEAEMLPDELRSLALRKEMKQQLAVWKL